MSISHKLHMRAGNKVFRSKRTAENGSDPSVSDRLRLWTICCALATQIGSIRLADFYEAEDHKKFISVPARSTALPKIWVPDVEILQTNSLYSAIGPLPLTCRRRNKTGDPDIDRGLFDKGPTPKPNRDLHRHTCI
jgi:hypothetical protein